MATAYGSATLAACVTSIKFKQYLSRHASPFFQVSKYNKITFLDMKMILISKQFQRYVPFAAVAAANCVNIPLMRQNELLKGVDVFDSDKNRVGCSKVFKTHRQLGKLQNI